MEYSSLVTDYFDKFKTNLWEELHAKKCVNVYAVSLSNLQP